MGFFGFFHHGFLEVFVGNLEFALLFPFFFLGASF